MSDQEHAKILIVDDDEKLTFVLSAHMRSLGYEVEVAHEAQTVAACVHSFQPDVIVMDVRLPGGDGISLTRALKSDVQTQDIPIIMLTGRIGTEDVVTALEAGAQEYVRKPFDFAELMARIATMYRLRRTRTALDDLLTSGRVAFALFIASPTG